MQNIVPENSNSNVPQKGQKEEERDKDKPKVVPAADAQREDESMPRLLCRGRRMRGWN